MIYYYTLTTHSLLSLGLSLKTTDLLTFYRKISKKMQIYFFYTLTNMRSRAYNYI